MQNRNLSHTNRLTGIGYAKTNHLHLSQPRRYCLQKGTYILSHPCQTRINGEKFQALILAQSEKYYTNIFEKTNSIFFFVRSHITSTIHFPRSFKIGDSSSRFSRRQLGNCDVELHQYVPILYASSQTASTGSIPELNHLG